MGLHSMREQLHAKILRLRSIDRLVSSRRFDRLWEDSDDTQRKEVIVYVEKEDRVALSKWIRHHPSLMTGEMSIRQLRSLASSMLIPNWSRMGKVALINAIKETEHGFEQNKNDC